MNLSRRGRSQPSADKESEQLLKEGLLKIYACGFYGEEEGGDISRNGDHWVVDPLDGTENMNGYPPLLAVSIGLLRERKTCPRRHL